MQVSDQIKQLYDFEPFWGHGCRIAAVTRRAFKAWAGGRLAFGGAGLSGTAAGAHFC